MSDHAIALAGLVIAVVGAVLTVFGLGIAVWTLRRGNKNASAAMVLTINENFRQAWARVLGSTGKTRAFELHELLNLIETVCAIHQERSLTGVSRKLVETYLCEILRIIGKDLEVRRAIANMRNAPTTFEHLRAFFLEMRLAGKAVALERVATGEVSPEVAPAAIAAAATVPDSASPSAAPTRPADREKVTP